MIPALALLVAIVVEDSTPMRAAPNDAAPRQAELWRGDWLEVRGQVPGYYQVWDHRHERPGYVREWRVRTYDTAPASAPELRAVVRFLRDSPGSESLGLAYAALFLKSAAAGEPASDVHDAIGVMAERLARRSSAATQSAPGAVLAEHRAVAESYGVAFVTTERDGRIQLAYDGEAFRTVLATSTVPAERARATLALTAETELAADAGPVVVRTWNEWRYQVLMQVDPSELPPHVAGPIRLRRARVLAWLAHAYASIDDAERAREAASKALFELAQVDRGGLLADDAPLLDDTAVRVAAVRNAAALGVPADRAGAGKVSVDVRREDDGRSCITIRGVSGGGAGDSKPAPLAERCTFGVVWTGSTRVSARGNAVAIAVEPLPGWTELWVFREQSAGDFAVDMVVPAATTPGAGYVEAAGFSHDGRKLAVVRDAIVEGRRKRSFEVLATSDLTTEIRSPTLDRFATFRKLAAPDWQVATLALQ